MSTFAVTRAVPSKIALVLCVRSTIVVTVAKPAQ
jgi:hypothetical protein